MADLTPIGELEPLEDISPTGAFEPLDPSSLDSGAVTPLSDPTGFMVPDFAAGESANAGRLAGKGLATFLSSFAPPQYKLPMNIGGQVLGAIGGNEIYENIIGKHLRPEPATGIDKALNVIGGAGGGLLGERLAKKGLEVSGAQKALDQSAADTRLRTFTGGSQKMPFAESPLKTAEETAEGAAKITPDFMRTEEQKGLELLSKNGMFKGNLLASPKKYGKTLVGMSEEAAKDIDNAVTTLDKNLINPVRITRDEIAQSAQKYMTDIAADPKLADAANKKMTEILDAQFQGGMPGKSWGPVDGKETTFTDMLNWKRSLGKVTKFEGEGETAAVNNEIRKRLYYGIRDVMNQKALEASKPLGTQLVNANELETAVFTADDLITNFARMRRSKDILQRNLEWGNVTRGLAATGVGGIVGGPVGGAIGLTTYLASQNPAVRMGLAKVKEAGGLLPEVGSMITSGPVAMGTNAAANAIAPEAQAESLPPPPNGPKSLSLPVPNGLSQALQGSQQAAPPSPMAPADPFANGLPRDTNLWDMAAVNRFAKFALGKPPEIAGIAQGLVQKFATALHQEDKGKLQRIVADMAKLFPDAFEAGMGIDNKIFHPDDQGEYLDQLLNGVRKGLVEPSFLARQRDAFLNKNDSAIIPIEKHVQQQVMGGLKNKPPQGNQPRQYSY